MSRISDLQESYRKFIALKWDTQAAYGQRTIFGIYDPMEELKLQFAMGAFEADAKAANHEWKALDLGKVFSQWLSESRYKERYFNRPNLLNYEKFLPYVSEYIQRECGPLADDPNAVVALYNCGALFGFLKIQRLVDAIGPHIKGHLLVFFPGSAECSEEGTNLKLLNAYDGWNYLAIILNNK